MLVIDYIYVHTTNEENNIIINSLTGAIDIVTKELAKALKYKDINQIKKMDNDILNNLKSRGYIVESKECLDDMIKKTYEKYLKHSNYNIYTILPTYKCNLACTYCFEGNVTQNNICLTDKMIDNIFNYIENDSKRTTDEKRIQLFGGEPLLKNNLPIIEKILIKCKKNNIDGVDVITNGTQLCFFYDLFTQYKEYIRSIQITIDGPKHIHDKRRINRNGEGTFEKINDNIMKFLKAGFPVTIRTNLDASNINYANELIDYYYKRYKEFNNFKYYFAPVRGGCKECSNGILTENELIKKVEEIGKERKDLDYPIEGIKVLAHVRNILEGREHISKVVPNFHYCEAVNGRQIIFGPEGKCFTCGQAVSNEELSIGSYYPEIKLHENKKNKWASLSVMNKKKCSSCPICFFCGGGCAYNSWDLTGNIDNSVECNEKFNILNEYLNRYKKKNGI